MLPRPTPQSRRCPVASGRTDVGSTIVFVGGGPKTTGILLSLAASLRQDSSRGGPLDIHVIDPYRVGGGRIWRHEQSPTLWMNSVARDVTIFPDSDASLSAAPVTGPDLATWVAGEGREELERRGLGPDADRLTPTSFAPRQVQAAYLAWAFDRAIAHMPENVRVHVHRSTASRIVPSQGRRRVVLDGSAGEDEIIADVVVLAQGFIEIMDDPDTTAMKSAAERHGLTYIAPGYTADVDLSSLLPGQDVLVRGFGLAFVDAMMMLTEDRGGVFRGKGKETRYVPSGREPVLWVGSRRGVPYRSKLGYLPEGMRVGPTRYMTRDNAASLAGERDAGAEAALSVQDDIMPLVDMELFVAHYSELAYRHPERVDFGIEDVRDKGDEWCAEFLEGRTEDAAAARAAADEWARDRTPDPRDHYDLGTIDRPLRGMEFGSLTDVENTVAQHVRQDIDRAADPAWSQDSARFHALVGAYYVVRELVSQGAFSAEDRIQNFDAGFHGLFSYIASGPPPQRLENLLALHRAGLVRFLGPDTEVGLRHGRFETTAGSCPETVSALSLFEARLARISAERAKDELLRDLIDRGELRLENSGGAAAKFLIDATNRALDASGAPQDDLLMVGPSVAGSVEEAFTRPGTDAHVFRDNERLAQRLLAAVQLESPAGVS
jgi:uncharacterized NAD(P)/FAD-binding protein YdhS